MFCTARTSAHRAYYLPTFHMESHIIELFGSGHKNGIVRIISMYAHPTLPAIMLRMINDYKPQEDMRKRMMGSETGRANCCQLVSELVIHGMLDGVWSKQGFKTLCLSSPSRYVWVMLHREETLKQVLYCTLTSRCAPNCIE